MWIEIATPDKGAVLDEVHDGSGGEALRNVRDRLAEDPRVAGTQVAAQVLLKLELGRDEHGSGHGAAGHPFRSLVQRDEHVEIERQERLDDLRIELGASAADDLLPRVLERRSPAIG